MDRPKWTDVAIVILTGGIVFLGYMQWNEMHEGGKDTHDLAVQAKSQADAAKSLADSTKNLADRMKDQADRTKVIADQAVVQAQSASSAAKTADASLKDSRSSFRQEQRAYVAVTVFTMSNPPTRTDKNGRHVCGDVHVANSGRTPAVNTAIFRYATFGPKAQATIEAFKPPERTPPSGAMLGIVGDNYGTACTEKAVDTTTEQNLVNGTLPLYVYGVIEYDDIFGNPHQTGFCSERVIDSTAFIGCADDHGEPFGNWFERKK